MFGTVEETVSDRLIISLACGIGIAVEEMDNIRTQILVLAKEQGLLIGEVPKPVEHETIEVATVYVPDKELPRTEWTTHTAWAAVALILIAAFGWIGTPAKAERDWLSPGPPVTRILKTLDGKFHVVTVTRAQPGHPCTEIVMERDITAMEVPAELARIMTNNI